MRKLLIPILSFLFLVSCIDYNTDSGLTNVDPEPTENNDVRMWITTDSKSFLSTELEVDYTSDVSNLMIRVDPTETYQTIDGFGGTLTGSSAYLFQQMSADARAEILKKLFDPKTGAGLESLRIAIGASDFSMDLYTYCDKEGIENFAIPEIDKRDLIPTLKEILAINPNVKIIASPWSPPAWMKSTGKLNSGTLKGEEIYDDYATYFVKFIQAMKTEGITIDAITLQNESDFESGVHPSMKLSPEQHVAVIGKYLGPKFDAAGIKTKILVLDHNYDIYKYAITMLEDATAYKYIYGTAFHGYNGSPSSILYMKNAYPDKSVYQTELSGGDWNETDEMKTMFYYLSDQLVPCIQNGSSNFLMFNIALNSSHGPVTPGGTFCEDCRGIVTIDGDNVKQELEYYMFNHFGKVARTGSKLIKSSYSGSFPDGVTSTAFLNPDGSRGLVVINQSGSDLNTTISDEAVSKRVVYKIPNQSVVSFLFK